MKLKILAVLVVLVTALPAQAFNFGKMVGALTGGGNNNNSSVSSPVSVEDSGYVQAYMETINRARQAYSYYEIAMKMKDDTAAERAHLASLEGSFVTTADEAYDQLVSIDESVVSAAQDSYKNVGKLSEADKAKALEAIDMYRSAVYAQREKRDTLVNFWTQHGISSGVEIAQQSAGGDIGSIIGAVVGTVASTAGHISRQKELAREMDRSLAISESVLYSMDRVEEMIRSGEGVLSEENLDAEFTDDEEGEEFAEDLVDAAAEGVFVDEIQSGAAEVAEELEGVELIEGSSTTSDLKLGIVEESADLTGKHPDFVKGFNQGMQDQKAGKNSPDYSKSVYYIDGYQQGFWHGN